MLPRTAVRALRVRPGLATSRTAAPLAATSQRIRLYASNRPPRKDNTWKKSDPIKFDKSNKSRSNPVNPKEQPEFDGAAAPGRNTAPKTSPGPNTSNTTAQSGASRDFASEQDGLSGPQSRKQNTDATTESAQQPQKPLPDLRHGIPSTFAAEYAEAEQKAKRDPEDPANVTEDPLKEPPPGGAGGRDGGGELPKSAYETSTDRRRNRVANIGYLVTLLFGAATAAFMGRNWETEEEEKANPDAPSGWTPALMYKRAIARVSNQKSYYTEPAFQKLLPDKEKAFPPGTAPPLTLVLSLEDLLVHSEWTTKHGWRTAKRPGVDYFLRYLSQYYELVIFTSAKSMDGSLIVQKLDPFRIVAWPLYREATRYEKGEYIKDLSHLNRDLSSVILIDTDHSHAKAQPENAIILPKWKGEPRDAGLVKLIPFLEYLAMLSTGGPFDVRGAIKSMENKDIATEFARREAALREEFNRDQAAQKAKKGKSAGGFVMGALGLNKPQQGDMILADGTSVREGMAQGKMMIDMFREIGRKQYEAMEKEIRENGEKILKDMAEEEKKLQEQATAEMKASAFSWLGGGGGNSGSSNTPPPEKK